MNSRRRRYRNPPLVEALAEIHFDPAEPWDPTIFGRLNEKIASEYPIRETLEGYNLGVVGPDVMRQLMKKAGTRMRFIRSDQSGMVQVAENLLVVNAIHKGNVAPYPGWDRFKPSILARLSDYVGVASPSGIVRIGLRYINRIRFDRDTFRFGTAFSDSPFVPRVLGEARDAFMVRVEVPRDHSDHLIVTVGVVSETDPSQISVILDIDHVSKRVQISPVPGQVGEILENAHNEIEEVFESCLTPDLRRRFGEEGERL